MPAPSEFLTWVDASTDAFIMRLAHAVPIPSISGDPAYRPRVQEMSDWLNAELTEVGVETKQVDLGNHVMDGQTLPLPHAILGKIGNDKNKKTVLIYGHFDVQPAALSDRWASELFTLTTLPDGRLVGRGSSDDKGPVLGWLAVLQWHHKTQTPLAVNLRFCFERMEENGSEGLDELVEREREGWLGGVDCMCISDNYWLNTRTPALTYSLRGHLYFKINVSGPGRDLHSGAYLSSLSLAFALHSTRSYQHALVAAGGFPAHSLSLLALRCTCVLSTNLPSRVLAPYIRIYLRALSVHLPTTSTASTLLALSRCAAGSPWIPLFPSASAALVSRHSVLRAHPAFARIPPHHAVSPRYCNTLLIAHERRDALLGCIALLAFYLSTSTPFAPGNSWDRIRALSPRAGWYGVGWDALPAPFFLSWASISALFWGVRLQVCRARVSGALAEGPPTISMSICGGEWDAVFDFVSCFVWVLVLVRARLGVRWPPRQEDTSSIVLVGVRDACRCPHLAWRLCRSTVSTHFPGVGCGRARAHRDLHTKRIFHTGVFGRTVHEPMTDLISLMSRLVDAFSPPDVRRAFCGDARAAAGPPLQPAAFSLRLAMHLGYLTCADAGAGAEVFLLRCRALVRRKSAHRARSATSPLCRSSCFPTPFPSRWCTDRSSFCARVYFGAPFIFGVRGAPLGVDSVNGRSFWRRAIPLLVSCAPRAARKEKRAARAPSAWAPGFPSSSSLRFGLGVVEIYEKLDYSIADVEGAAGGKIALSEDKRENALRLRESERAGLFIFDSPAGRWMRGIRICIKSAAGAVFLTRESGGTVEVKIEREREVLIVDAGDRRCRRRGGGAGRTERGGAAARVGEGKDSVLMLVLGMVLGPGSWRSRLRVVERKLKKAQTWRWSMQGCTILARARARVCAWRFWGWTLDGEQGSPRAQEQPDAEQLLLSWR
ncbi:hypothetical protein B0H16DRAFT_1719260 [Mycena metata]|uniref:Glutamate carboxypeptidase n=1 Tax=Mycena metata TaxID=1033252 RepID=A0AAD7JGR8_9AGAR|nr:hypothetical protein B0H16DRAFT_1719260 [Mycena metata]